MDNSKQSLPSNDGKQTVVNPTPTSAPAQSASVPTPAAPISSGGSNKIMLFFIIIVVVVVALIGGVYFYLSKQPEATPASTNPPVVQTPSKPEETVDALDRDLQSVNAASLDDEFSTIDEDLQKL